MLLKRLLLLFGQLQEDIFNTLFWWWLQDSLQGWGQEISWPLAKFIFWGKLCLAPNGQYAIHFFPIESVIKCHMKRQIFMLVYSLHCAHNLYWKLQEKIWEDHMLAWWNITYWQRGDCMLSSDQNTKCQKCTHTKFSFMMGHLLSLSLFFFSVSPAYKHWNVQPVQWLAFWKEKSVSWVQTPVNYIYFCTNTFAKVVNHLLSVHK